MIIFSFLVTVIKSRFIISINVDQFSSEPNVGIPDKHTQLDTTRPLFLGGHPHLAKIRGIKGRHNYQGCIRNFKINGAVENIKPDMSTGMMIKILNWNLLVIMKFLFQETLKPAFVHFPKNPISIHILQNIKQ